MAVIGALIWKVAADTSELKENVRSVDAQLTKMGQAGEKVGTMLRQAFSVGAIIGLAKSAIDAGDAIGDLSARAKISAESFQKLTTVLAPAGVEAEQFTQSILFMQRALAGDNKSAAAALNELGLKVDDLRRKSPDQAFLDIAEAVASVEDPMKRSRIETELFGKAGSAVAAGFSKDMKQAAADTQVMSNDAVEGMSKLSDVWDKLLRDGKRLLAEVLTPLVPALSAVGSALSYMVDGVSGLARKIPEMIGPLGALGKTLSDWKTLVTGDVGMPNAPKALGLATNAGYSATAMSETDVDTAIKELKSQADKTTANQKRLADASEEAAQALWAQAQMAKKLANETGWLAGMPGGNWQLPTGGWNGGGGGLNTIGNLGPGFSGMRTQTGAMGYSGFALSKVPGFDWGKLGFGGLNAAMPFLSQLVTGGSQSGQLGGSIGGGIGGALGSVFSGATGVMGAIAPFLGPAMGLIGGLVGKLFGPSKGAIAGKEADSRIASTQAGLLQQYGSLANIAAMGSAGADLAAAWGSKNVSGEANFNKLLEAFQRQNDLLDQQKAKEAELADLEAQRAALVDSLTPKYQDMANAAAALGISMDGLGPNVDQLAANESWGATLNAIDTLVRGGAEVGNVLNDSAGKLSAMTAKSIELGTTVSESMRPYLENLAQAGKLVDAATGKTIDLTEVKWGSAIETESEKTEKKIKAIDDLMETLRAGIQTIVDTLANKLPSAAATGVAGVEAAINNAHPVLKVSTEVESPDLPGYASGSGGLVNFGRGTIAMLHGNEAVLTEAQYRAWQGSQGGGVQTIVVQNVLDGDLVSESVMRRVGGGQFAYAGVR